MKKLIQGIINFRKNKLKEYREKFSKLALGQSPDALLIACCDSRVAPNAFASTDPGDLFVLRNIGNLVPSYTIEKTKTPHKDNSVAAALEFSVLTLNVLDIIVCGHSDCGAMHALLSNTSCLDHSALRTWLQHAKPAYQKLSKNPLNNSHLAVHNQLSQLNVIQQVEHLKTYPYISERLKTGKLTLHGWWFDLTSADIYHFNQNDQEFILLDEDEANTFNC